MTVRAWWDNAKDSDQATVLMHLGLDGSLAGIPWAFLPNEVKCLLSRRARINEQQLDPQWRRG